TPSTSTSTGLILDADLELNSQDYTFATPTTTGTKELLPVLAHELGHFLGLDHSYASGALMSQDYMSLSLGSNLITQDDAEGICTLYPPNQSPACGDPGAPSYDACLVDPSAPPECHLASVHQDATGCGCRVATRRASN